MRPDNVETFEDDAGDDDALTRDEFIETVRQCEAAANALHPGTHDVAALRAIVLKLCGAILAREGN